MARCPTLAVRYDLPEANKTRRIQMRFTSEHDFEVAYDHVRELGLWFTPVSPRPATPAPSVQHGGPYCPPSQLSEVNARPGTAVASSSSPLHSQSKDTTSLRPSTASFFQPGSSASARRPDSAVTLVSDLPPRRELPFERLDSPVSAGNDSIRSGSRPLSGVMGPPTLPASALSGRPRPNSRAGSGHGIDLPPLREPTYINETFTRQAPKLNASLGSGTNPLNSVRPQSAFTQNEYAAMQQMMSSPPVLQPPRPASSYHTTTAHPLSVVTNTKTTQAHPSASLATPPMSDANIPDDAMDTHAEELAAYAKQPNEVRLNELNNFIFQHLQDDNFLALVDDMQQAWSRIGSGLE